MTLAQRRQSIAMPNAMGQCNTLPSEPTPLLACLARMGDDTLARCGLPAISWTLCEILPDGDRKPIVEALRLVQDRLVRPARTLEELAKETEPGPVEAREAVIVRPVVVEPEPDERRPRAKQRTKREWIDLAIGVFLRLEIGASAGMWRLLPASAQNHKSAILRALAADGRFVVTQPQMGSKSPAMIRRVR